MNSTLKTSFLAALGVAAALMVPATQAATVNVTATFDSGASFSNPGLTGVPGDGSLSGFTAWSVATPGTSVGNLLGVGGTKAISSTGWDGTGNAFRFSFDVAAGSVLNITSLSFSEQGSNGSGRGLGPNAWSLSVEASQIWSGTGTRGSFGTWSNTSPTGVSNLSGTVDFILSASGAQAASTFAASTATWRVDNFNIQGTVTPAPVPLPAAVWLMGSALAGVVALRRRQA